MSNTMLGVSLPGEMRFGNGDNSHGLITDRTQEHVDRLLAFQSLGWARMTASERELWYGEIAKGAYNYTDLNRVEAAVTEISDILELNLVTKTNWTMWDKPTRTEMERYLGNVATIRELCAMVPDMPQLPSSMDNLTYKDANNIEKVLLVAYEMSDVIASTWIRSGEIYSGEV